MNLVVPVVHCRINTLNHCLHIGCHCVARLFLDDQHIPKRGAGRTKEENRALDKGDKKFKQGLWNEPIKIPDGKPDPTGR